MQAVDARRLGPKQTAILERLASHEWVKGRELSDSVEVLPSIIFHYIERLRDRGFDIEGHSSKGYRLIPADSARKEGF